MSYVNQIPTSETVATLGSRYTYEEIVAAITEANAVNAEHEATYQDVWNSVAAHLSSTDFIYMSDDDRKLFGAFNSVANGMDGVSIKGAIGRGSSEFWPVARARKDIATVRRQIAKMRKFRQSL